MFQNLFFNKKDLINQHSMILFILLLFNIIILAFFNNYPIRSDEIGYVEYSMYPTENKKLFFRFYHFYMGKIFSYFFSTPLIAAKYCSIFLSNLIIFFSYKIILLNTNSKFTSNICALVISTYPHLLLLSTNYSTDITATCIALFYIYQINKIILKKDVNKNYLILGFLLVVGIFSKQSNIILIIPTLFLLYFKKRDFKFTLYLIGILIGFIILSILDFIFLKNFFYHIDPRNYIEFLERFSNQYSKDVVEKIKRTGSYTNEVYSTIPWLTYMMVPICFGYFSIKSILLKRNTLVILSLTIASILLFEFVHIPYAGLKLAPRYLIIFNIPLIIVFFLSFHEKIDQIENTFFNNILINLIFIILFCSFLYFLKQNHKFAIMASQFFLLICIFLIPIILGFWITKNLNFNLLIILLTVIILNNFSIAFWRFPYIHRYTNDFNYVKDLLKNCPKNQISIKIENNKVNQNLIMYIHADKIINQDQFKSIKKNLINNNYKEIILKNSQNITNQNCNLNKTVLEKVF